MRNWYGARAVKKYCLGCGFSAYLCPDVEHDCPVCHSPMVNEDGKAKI